MELDDVLYRKSEHGFPLISIFFFTNDHGLLFITQY